MIIKLIRIKNDLLNKSEKIFKIKVNIRDFWKNFKNWSNFKEIFWNVYIRLLFSNNFLTNYISGKIEGHVPFQSTVAKNGEGARAPKAPRSTYN